MKKTLFISAIAFSGIVIYSCNKEKDTLTTTAYLELPAQPYAYFTTSSSKPEVVDSIKKLNSKATLGRVLFYDTHMSLNNAISCGSCHKQELGFADNVAFSRGFEGRLTGRNSPGINGLTTHGSFFWDGRENVLDNLIMRPVSNHIEMGIDDLNTIPAKLKDLPYYSQLFTDAYGDAGITLERISMAVGCFIRTIGQSPNVKVLPGGGQLTALETKGQLLFDTVYDCANCHRGGGGGYNGGGSFLDIGLDNSYTDKGFGAITGESRDIGTFKVPNLTNVALTAPYMHDGRYKSLDEVLDHYSHGISNSPNLSPLLKDNEINGVPIRMDITESDKKAIIAFLARLTDHATNTDIKFSNPFIAK